MFIYDGEYLKLLKPLYSGCVKAKRIQYGRTTPLPPMNEFAHVFPRWPLVLLLCGHVFATSAQDINFDIVFGENPNEWSGINDLVQDRKGFIWFTSEKGLQRYDGSALKSFRYDETDPNSISSDVISCIVAEKDSDVIWVGTNGSGLNRYNTASHTNTRYTHDISNPLTISSDSITRLFIDRSGMIWIGTTNGLNALDPKSGSVKRYLHKADQINSLSYKRVSAIVEDSDSVLWVGCGTLFSDLDQGGLNRFNKSDGTFKRFLHEKGNPNSLAGNNVGSLYEDSHGVVWVGTNRDGLHSINRATEAITHYYYDEKNPDQISRPRQIPDFNGDNITFIGEDNTGMLWIGTAFSGLTKVDQADSRATRYGYFFDAKNNGPAVVDTTSGYKDWTAMQMLQSRDGVLWFSTWSSIIRLDYDKSIIPYYGIDQEESNSLYLEPNGKTLWVATDNGLLRRDIEKGQDYVYANNPNDPGSLSSNVIYSMKRGSRGEFWLGTWGAGLNRFDPATGKFEHYRTNAADKHALIGDLISNIFIDDNDDLWISTTNGISRLNQTTNKFFNYQFNRDSTTLYSNVSFCVAPADKNGMWAATANGIWYLSKEEISSRRYAFPNTPIQSVFVDSQGIAWAGGIKGLYRFNKEKDRFELVANGSSPVSIQNVLDIIEDNRSNLWINTRNSIVKVSSDRKKLETYTDRNGVHENRMGYTDDFKAHDGRLFMGHRHGYYAFFPDSVKSPISIAPTLIITDLHVMGNTVLPNVDGIINAGIDDAKEVRLSYHQNTFSFDFLSIDFQSERQEHYQFMLENFNEDWISIGGDRKALLYNVPPGDYIFRVKVINGHGSESERSLAVVIMPPWWRTKIAYAAYVLILLTALFGIYRIQKDTIVRRERSRARERELEQAREIEKSYVELKATQAQLIHSEKMASLGELTAGIAHEIQNPLNFVNNFSEINKELLSEMAAEMESGNMSNSKALLQTLSDNHDKINQHGKKADSIIKNMLEHSRSRSGKKEPVDLNVLCDEYLRLAYHGLRAKDRSFNAAFETKLDPTLPKVHVVPQDIGRVLLNLINNAFYAVNDKKKSQADSYEPQVIVSSAFRDSHVELRVSDNGNGIPSNIREKIFQPFFTTKPTGQGTGLGLSLSYDIVKAHGGSLTVETKEGEGTTFVCILNLSHPS